MANDSNAARAVLLLSPSFPCFESFEFSDPSVGPTNDVIGHPCAEENLIGTLFPFLAVPRELRDYIYNLVFVLDTPIYPSKRRAAIHEHINLLRANKQVYGEAAVILYGRNTFRIRGHPGWASPEFLNLLSLQKRDGYLGFKEQMAALNSICIGRHHLRRLIIPSHGISLPELKHLFSLLKHFPNLEFVQVTYLGSRFIDDRVPEERDRQVVEVCRLLRDRRPLLLELRKRISYSEAEDISWMVQERPYRTWVQATEEHMWEGQDGELRRAAIVQAPQQIPE